MADNPRSYRRDVRGRFARPVPDVDAESRFDPMGDDIPAENISAADVRPGMEVRRHAPDADDLAGQPHPGPLRPRTARLVPAEEHPETVYAGRYGEVSRAAARRSASPVDPSAWLTGADDGLSPEVRAQVLARRQTPAPVTVHGDRDGD